MKNSKKEILDKYEQGEFIIINYKNGLPPEELARIRTEKLNQVITKAIRSSDDMVAVVEEAKKQQAIAFAEWIHSDGWEPTEDRKWGKYFDVRKEGMSHDVLDWVTHTTEQLYQEYLRLHDLAEENNI